MTIARRDRYYCSARREKGTCAASQGIKAEDLEGRVLDGLRRILVGNEDLLEEFTVEFKRELARLRESRMQSDRPLRKELVKVERGIARCVDFIVSGEGVPDSVRTRLHHLETRKLEIETRLQTIPSDPVVEIHPSFPELYAKKVATLGALLEDDASRAEETDAIRSLIDRIEVRPGAGKGPCEVTLVGSLAGLLQFSQRFENRQNTNAARVGGGTFLLVAGARCQRYLLELSQAVA